MANRRYLACLLIVWLSTSPAEAIDVNQATAIKFRRDCQLVVDMYSKKQLEETEYMDAVACLSLLQGFKVGWTVSQHIAQEKGTKPSMICFPEDVKGEDSTVQMAAIVVKYVDDNPTDSHLSWAVIVGRAFQEFYPCE